MWNLAGGDHLFQPDAIAGSVGDGQGGEDLVGLGGFRGRTRRRPENRLVGPELALDAEDPAHGDRRPNLAGSRTGIDC